MQAQAVILFDSAGQARCLYSELIDLRTLGRLKVRRATRIEFDERTQCWRVRPARGGPVLFASPARGDCLAWEQASIAP